MDNLGIRTIDVNKTADNPGIGTRINRRADNPGTGIETADADR